MRKLQELWILAREEKKKLGVLVVLFAVLSGVGVRAFVSGGPRSAAASVAGAEGEQDGVAKTNQELNAERSGAFITSPRAASLVRNLFALDERFFPEPVQPSQVDEDAGAVVTVVVQSVDDPAEAEEPSLVELIEEESRRLKLSSTLTGSNPIAVIEMAGGGKDEREVVGLGHEVMGFRVVEIRSTVVVLEKQGVRVELRLALPEGQ